MSQADRKADIAARLGTVRDRTLWLLDQVPEEFFRRRVHSFYSPIGWHFGHVGRTEEYWVISAALKRPVRDEKLIFLFADLPDNPKDNRVNLPSIEEIKQYLADTRSDVLDALDQADLEADDPYFADGYAWEFALQHECQHQETIAEMLCLIHRELDPSELPRDAVVPEWKNGVRFEKLAIPGWKFCMGSDDRHGYDNEKGEHQILLDSFIVDKYPVTSFQWSEFIADGGYEAESLWSEEGWKWRQDEQATQPEYWKVVDGVNCMIGPHGLRPIHPDEPASCLSWHEADAYCRWAGRRMLDEVEWEYIAKAGRRRYPWGEELPSEQTAVNYLRSWHPEPVGTHPAGESLVGVQDLAGNVWEWTSSKFLPYPGFEAFPYDGYSKDHMKGEHRVCRGGSWATADPILRTTFRNWYVPTYRQGFLGLRCAD